MPVKKVKIQETPEAATAAGPEAVNKPARKRAAAKAPAATHKSAAPRAASKRTAPAVRVRKAAGPKPAFDASLHQWEIEREAYFLWEARGYAHGNETEDWFRAVEIVRARHE
jgi:hypothetical protein